MGAVGDPLLVLFDFSFAERSGDLLSCFGVVLGKDEAGGASFLGLFGRQLFRRSPRVGRSFGGLGVRQAPYFLPSVMRESRAWSFWKMGSSSMTNQTRLWRSGERLRRLLVAVENQEERSELRVALSEGLV